MTADHPDHPIARAVALCRLTRETFGLHDAVNLGWLMERWNVRAGTGLSPQALDLVVQLVLHGDRDPRPMTQREADELVTDLVRHDDLAHARREAQRYATIRGLPAAQAQKLDQLVRDRWHALHAEVADAA